MGDQLQEKSGDRANVRSRRSRGDVRSREEDGKSIRDLKEVSVLGNSFVECDAKRMIGPSRLFSTEDRRAEEEKRRGVAEAVRFGSGHDTCSRSFQLSVKVRPGSENHQPISLSARSPG